jgi:hypothetical protein
MLKIRLYFNFCVTLRFIRLVFSQDTNQAYPSNSPFMSQFGERSFGWGGGLTTVTTAAELFGSSFCRDRGNDSIFPGLRTFVNLSQRNVLLKTGGIMAQWITIWPNSDAIISSLCTADHRNYVLGGLAGFAVINASPIWNRLLSVLKYAVDSSPFALTSFESLFVIPQKLMMISEQHILGCVQICRLNQSYESQALAHTS